MGLGWSSPGPTGRDRTRTLEVLASIQTVVVIVGLVAAKVMMVALVAAGLLEIGRGLLGFFATGHPTGESVPADLMLHHALKGMELLFLAPLPFLVLRGLQKYVGASVAPERHEEARHSMLEIKGYAVALMIAAIATTVVEQAVSHALDLSSATGSAIVILVLAGYFVGLECLSSARSRGHKGQPPERTTPDSNSE